jgi:hypothetical protein
MPPRCLAGNIFGTLFDSTEQLNIIPQCIIAASKWLNENEKARIPKWLSTQATGN